MLRMGAELGTVVFLGTIALVISAVGDDSSGALQPSMLALTALGITGGLVLDGAREHPQRTTITTRLALGIGACTVAGSIVAVFANVVVPWWAPVAATIVMIGLVLPVNIVKAVQVSPAPTARRRAPLDRPARITMACLAAMLGLTTTCVGVGIDSGAAASLSLLAAAFFLAGIIASTTPRATSFRLQRLGRLWSAPQWLAFGLCAALVVTIVVLRVFTTAVGPLAGMVAGLVTASLLVGAAFLPASRLPES